MIASAIVGDARVSVTAPAVVSVTVIAIAKKEHAEILLNNIIPQRTLENN